MKKLNITGYHSQTNGIVEKFKSTLTNMIAKSCESRPLLQQTAFQDKRIMIHHVIVGVKFLFTTMIVHNVHSWYTAVYTCLLTMHFK